MKFENGWTLHLIFHTMVENYYKLLGIPSDASQEEIKRAYQKLILKCHPDKTTGRILSLSNFTPLLVCLEFFLFGDFSKDFGKIERLQ